MVDFDVYIARKGAQRPRRDEDIHLVGRGAQVREVSHAAQGARTGRHRRNLRVDAVEARQHARTRGRELRRSRGSPVQVIYHYALVAAPDADVRRNRAAHISAEVIGVALPFRRAAILRALHGPRPSNAGFAVVARQVHALAVVGVARHHAHVVGSVECAKEGFFDAAGKDPSGVLRRATQRVHLNFVHHRLGNVAPGQGTGSAQRSFVGVNQLLARLRIRVAESAIRSARGGVVKREGERGSGGNKHHAGLGPAVTQAHRTIEQVGVHNIRESAPHGPGHPVDVILLREPQVQRRAAAQVGRTDGQVYAEFVFLTRGEAGEVPGVSRGRPGGRVGVARCSLRGGVTIRRTRANHGEARAHQGGGQRLVPVRQRHPGRARFIVIDGNAAEVSRIPPTEEAAAKVIVNLARSGPRRAGSQARQP